LVLGFFYQSIGNMRYIIKILPTIILLVLCAVYLNYNRSALEPLLSIKIAQIFSLNILMFIFFITTGYTFYLLARFLSVRLNVLETIGLTFLTNFGNYLGPTRPGAAIKAVYLKGVKGLSYANFSAILAANSFVLLFVSGFTGAVLLLVLWIDTSSLSISLLIVCLILMSLSMVPFVLHLRSINRDGRVWQVLNNAINGFEIIKSQKYKLLGVCLTILFQYIMGAIILITAYHAIGKPVSLIEALLIGVFTSISNFFTITPNNIGVQEIIMAYLYTITGMDFTSGLVGASLVRAIHISLTFTLSPFFIYFMLKSTDLVLADILPGRITIKKQ
jgi:uncharacterized membrane protein YbhN (UPF0104 family)